MSEEHSQEFLHTNGTFISTLNPDCPPFQPLSSSSFQSIQEVSSNLNNMDTSNDDRNEFHIESTVIDNSPIDYLHSNGIYSDQSTEKILSNTHHIKEIDQDDCQRIPSSHIENLDDESEQSTSPIISLKTNESFSTDDNLNLSTKLVDNDDQVNELIDQSSPQVNNDSDQEELIDQVEDEDEDDEAGDGNKVEEIPLETSIKEKNSSEFSFENEPSSKTETSIEIEKDLDENLNDQDKNLIKEESIEQNLSNEVQETEIVDPHLSIEKKENEFDDVLGNKSLLKKTIRSGENESRPPRNSLATISYELYLVNPNTNETKLIENIVNESFFVSEYDILPAIDICIQLMDRGELASIDSDIRHCYGNAGCPEKNIPQVKTNDHSYRMRIMLELHDWKQIDDIQSLSVEERILWGEKKRKSGNNFYRRKEYTIALQCYRHALRFLDIDENPLITDENDSIKSINNCYIQVENNRAQTFLLNEQYDQCLSSVENVLKHQPNNVKALFRKGKAFFQLGNYDQALKPLTILLKIDSDDVEKDKVNEMVRTCQTKLAKYHQNQKEICQRMFQSKTSPNASTNSRIENEKQKEAKSNQWWGYAVIGGVALVALGLAAIIKYR